MSFLGKMRAVLSLGAALLAGAALAGPPTYPFGSRLEAYGHGIQVSNQTTAQLDQAIQQRYQLWKNARLASTVQTIPGGMAVKFADPPPNAPPNWQPPKLTVSEGIGYGMLLAVVMAGHDPQAQQIFDGLLTTARARPADGLANSNFAAQYAAHAPYLMEWELRPDGSHTGGPGDRWPAMDGDLDIALALLMAHRQWGSTGGAWNYQQEAVNTINAIKAWFTYPDGRVNLRQGGANRARTSDFMFQHFRAFRQATNDPHWDTVISRQLTMLETVIANHSPNAGLQPDFLKNTDTTPVPGLLDSYPSSCTPGQGLGDWTISDNWYFANAQRNPWRYGTDYVLSGDARVRAILVRMMNFFNADMGGDPNNAATGYKLDGTLDPCLFRPSPNWARGMIGPMLAGATVDASLQNFLNALWAWNRDNFATNYYDSELQLIPMIVASGNWWAPTPSGNPPPPPPPPPPTGTRIEAENGMLQGSGVSVKTDVAGFQGSGFVGNFSNNGDSLAVTFGNVQAGTYQVRIRYHAWTAQENTVSINGTARTVQFPATHPNWSEAVITGVQLAAGSNTVVITKDWGWINVDAIEIVQTSGSGSGGSGGTPVTIQVQAEGGSLSGSGVSVKTDVAGYQGSAFVGSFSANGDTLTIPFSNVVAGTYNLRIRYHAWTAQENTVSVNGTPRTVQFPATHPGWAVATVPGIALPAGNSTVTISKDWGWINVDWVEIAP